MNPGNPTSHCPICESTLEYYFSKTYPTYPGSPFQDAKTIDYVKCGHCGFVMSKTHAEMEPEEWAALNVSWHHHFERNIEQRITNQPPYADQSLALSMLDKAGLVDLDDCLDYAAGYGTMAKFMSKYFGRSIQIFDRYVVDEQSALRYVDAANLGKYRLVVNSAMFEHVLNRESLDEVNDLVADNGVLMLHTVVCETVPKNPDWFYLAPMVHTAFHTNRSMNILMEQWGYSHSMYSPQAKSWFLFKKDHPGIARIPALVRDINREIQTRYFFDKPGFVDYWKGF